MMEARRDPAAERDYAKDARALWRPALRRLSPDSRRLLERAELQARIRDDDHVGTEHLVLAIHELGQRAAPRALQALGITRKLLLLQLHDEPGPSPRGKIPLTPRARMIVGLAGAEATRRGSERVEPEHILLGAIGESRRWEATGVAGPHPLRAAAEAAGTTLHLLEEKVLQLMCGDG